MKRVSLMLLAFCFAAVMMSGPVEQKSNYNGLNLTLGNLSRLSRAKTRSISPENFSGEKSRGGTATEGTGAKAARDLGQGWKISPSVRITPRQVFTVAEIQGPGAIQHIWMTPTGHWRFSILRFYWDGESEPSVEVPVGDFFACGWGNTPRFPLCPSASIPAAPLILTGKCPSANPVRLRWRTWTESL